MIALAVNDNALFYTDHVHRQIANKNVNESMPEEEMEKILRSNKRTRQKFISGLEIPTYDNLSCVYFYDVLQLMTQTIVSF